MTKNKDFKNLVRERMDSTGENYTSARSGLIHSRDHDIQPATDPLTDAAQNFKAKTLRSFMPAGTLKAIPAKRKALVVILLEILPAFHAGRIYSEKEVNALLESFHPDFARLRRELIDYGYLDRDAHTGQYWVASAIPQRQGNIAQEAGVLESFLR